MELKITFNTAYWAGGTCNNFIFGLKSTVPFPEDTEFTCLGGAEATYISNDRTLVTFKPKPGFENIYHHFWHKDHHDGTRVYISGSDLSSLKTGSYSIKTVVSCLEPTSNLSDMSCSTAPTETGIPLKPTTDCPDTTPSITTTASQGAASTSG